MNGALLAVGAALVAVTVAQTGSVSVGELLVDADRFRGQPVMVRGTIRDVRDYVTRTGTRHYTFYLTDGAQTIRVISYTKPRCQSGAATVEGTFEQVKWRVRVDYVHQEITARNVICLSAHEEEAPPRGLAQLEIG